MVAISVVVAFLVGFGAFEIYRWKHGIPLKKANEIAAPLMRPGEVSGVAAHIYFAGGILGAVLICPSLAIATAAILMLVLGDGVAALVGMKWGKIRITWNRTLEGSFALFVVALLVALPLVSPEIALAGAGVAALAEYIPINDNLSIPILAGVAMTAAAYFL